MRNPKRYAPKTAGSHGVMDWFAGRLEGMERDAGSEIARLKPCSSALYRINHGARAMAHGMGIKHIAAVPAARLIRWGAGGDVKESRRRDGKLWPRDLPHRASIFHFGYDVGGAELKRLRRVRQSKKGARE